MLKLGIALGIATAILKGVDTLMNKSLMGTISLLLVYSIFEAVNILFHQLAIKSLNPIHAEMLSKSKALMTYGFSLFLMIEAISISGVCGILLFLDSGYRLKR